MSWFISYESKDAFEKDERSPGSFVDIGPSPQVAEQVAVARGAASGIIESGAVGAATGDFRVSLSGHANPGHAPTLAYANDCIAVNIYQKT